MAVSDRRLSFDLKRCPVCAGKGRDGRDKPCKACDGKGEIQPEKAEKK
jgi:DnaJ-class molecular chaperone